MTQSIDQHCQHQLCHTNVFKEASLIDSARTTDKFPSFQQKMFLKNFDPSRKIVSFVSGLEVILVNVLSSISMDLIL